MTLQFFNAQSQCPCFFFCAEYAFVEIKQLEVIMSMESINVCQYDQKNMSPTYRKYTNIN